MVTFPTFVKKYSSLWHKYRPALLQLMQRSADEPQSYKMSVHEFKDIDPKQKGGYAFTMRVLNSRSENDIKTSVVAQDLLMILQRSRKAQELTEAAIYEFTMDKQFVLHVTREEIKSEEESELDVEPTTEG